MVAEYEMADLEAQIEELQRQIWMLTQGDDLLKEVKTQSLSSSMLAVVKPVFLIDFGTSINGQEFTP